MNFKHGHLLYRLRTKELIGRRNNSFGWLARNPQVFTRIITKYTISWFMLLKIFIINHRNYVELAAFIFQPEVVTQPSVKDLYNLLSLSLHSENLGMILLDSSEILIIQNFVDFQFESRD